MSPVALFAHDLIKLYDAHPVLDGICLTAGPGQRLGLVGENGAGKSTLLRLLAGHEQPDGGTAERPHDCGFLHQQLPYPDDATVHDVREDALSTLRAAEQRLATLATHLQHHPDDPQVLADYGEVLQWATDHGLWDADRRADLVFTGLGLDSIDHCRRLDTLSGGEGSRLGLAALLIHQPRALLLDEPTNHLDDPAVAFLERHLANLPGAVVLASHDRVFLDAVCTGILDLDPTPTGPRYYGGAYTDYLHAKARERRNWQQQYDTEQATLAALRDTVATTARQVAPSRQPRDGDKMNYHFHGARVQAQVSRRVRNADQRLAALQRRQVRRPPQPLRFDAALTSQDAPTDQAAVSLRDVHIPGRLHVPHLHLSANDQLLVTGPNGAGKSTLLAVLAGALAPPAGTVAHRRGLRTGLLAQEVRFSDPQRTARQLYEADAPPAAVPLTELGLLAPRDLDRPVGMLSVGQRRRLALALLVARPPHLLLLDEPTNHLSLSLATELEQALGTAAGAVVAASHDRWLRRRWTGRRLGIAADHRLAAGT